MTSSYARRRADAVKELLFDQKLFTRGTVVSDARIARGAAERCFRGPAITRPCNYRVWLRRHWDGTPDAGNFFWFRLYGLGNLSDDLSVEARPAQVVPLGY
jgi:hypothetical protein